MIDILVSSSRYSMHSPPDLRMPFTKHILEKYYTTASGSPRDPMARKVFKGDKYKKPTLYFDCDCPTNMAMLKSWYDMVYNYY
jgi:hypothetical protein